MNNFLPYVILILAVVSVVLHYVGLGGLVVVPAGLAAILALVGMVFADPEKPVSSRVACVMAAILAASPLFAPTVQRFRLQYLEKQRARETATLYQTLNTEFDAIKPAIVDYFRKYQIMPDIRGGETLPFMDKNGVLTAAPPAEFRIPLDPFDREKDPLRWAAVPGLGVLAVSVGQDGLVEMPLPGVMLDPVPPADPMTMFAVLGKDPRWNTYDPTNGALGLGDIVHWHGQKEYKEAFAPLFSAWDKAHAKTPYNPTKRRRASDPDPDPQSIRDAKGAEALLAQGEYLAALALASRGALERSSYIAQWKDPDYQIDRIRGLALYQLAAFRESADALIEYTWGVPNDALAHYYLSAALFHGGNRNDAMVHAAAAAQIDAQSPVANQALAAMEILRGGGTPQYPVPWIVEQKLKGTEP